MKKRLKRKMPSMVIAYLYLVGTLLSPYFENNLVDPVSDDLREYTSESANPWLNNEEWRYEIPSIYITTPKF